MNKQQAINQFWRRFGVLAFEENSVPDDDTIAALIKAGVASSKFPYITYQVVTDDIYGVTALATASVWDRDTSWERADELSNTIASAIQQANTIKLDDGRLFIVKGTPFAQHMSEDGDKAIRRVVLNVGYQFFTQN